MLDVEFTQLSDPGRYADTTKTTSDICFPTRPSKCTRMAGFSPWPTAWADTHKGEVASQLAIETLLAGFIRREPASRTPALAPGASANCRSMNRAGRQSTAGMATTIVACALRSTGQSSRMWAIPAATWCARQATLLTRDHTVVNDQVRLGILSAQRSRGVAQSPSVEPVARQRPVCQRRDLRSPDSYGRRAAALLRRPAWLRVTDGHCRR